MFGFVIIGVFALAAAAGINAFRAARTQWQRAASELGLEWRGSAMSYGSISGTLHGLDVTVDTVNRSSGNSSNTVSRYRVAYPSLDLGLKISKETGFSRFTQRFRPDIEIGDAEFDRAVTVRGASGDAVRAFLSPERQEAIMNIVAASPTAVIDDDGVEIRSRRVDTKVDLIVTRTRRLAMLAATLAGSAPTPRVAEMRRKRAEHDLAGAAEAARRELGADPWLDTRREAAEVLYAAGDTARAGEEFRALERALPADREMTVMAQRAQQRQAPAAPPAAPPLPAAGTAETLFGGRLLGYEVTAKFDDGLRGRRVEWTGTLSRVRPADPGRVTATVVVSTIDHTLFGPVEVVAIADVPQVSRWDDRVGEQVTVRGTLETVDPIMRAFHIGAAVLS